MKNPSVGIAALLLSLGWIGFLIPPAQAAKVPGDSDRRPANLDEEKEKAVEKRDNMQRSVRIENYSAKPFVFQLFRSAGEAWSQPYTLPSRNMATFTAPSREVPTAQATMRAYGAPGALFIRFRSYNGWMVHKLICNNQYAFVQNKNGFGELVPPRNGSADPITTPGTEAGRAQQLADNYCYEQIVNNPGLVTE
jgi:hypothetical protein